MDLKRLINRTLFFVAICAVVMAITEVFGDVNSLVGVAIVVIGLMMLQRDLSVRPVWNTGVMILFTCMLGLGAFVSLLNPFLGILVNIAVVMTTVFATVHDLGSPLHFPFILGYAFMLSIPVTLEELPFRILALIAGSVATVVLNVIMNRNRMTKTSHNAVISMCDRISESAKTVMEGGNASVSDLEKLCSSVNSGVYDRLRDRFFASPRDATVIHLTSSLLCLGRAVIEKERDLKVLSNVISLMDDIKGHENGEIDLETIRSKISTFRTENKGADFAILTSAGTISSELEMLSKESVGERRKISIPSRERIDRMLKENLRRDSVRFTFAVRMAMMFSLWAFVWQYWNLENAKWLLYTTAALVQPYIEGTWRKSSMRIVGTLVGAFLFAVITISTGHDIALMYVALMMVSYLYTLIDPKRYDFMMMFITLMALLAAALADPRGDVLLERLTFIMLGVVASIAANMMILPYRLKDESVELGRRSMGISLAQIESLRRTANGEPPLADDAYLVLKSSSITQKMQMNDSRDPERPFSGFIGGQNAMTTEYAMLRKSLGFATPECKAKASEILESKKERISDSECEGLIEEEKEILMRTSSMMTMYRENRNRLADAVLALPD